MRQGQWSDEQEMADLVDEFLRSGSISEEIANEVERRCAAGKYHKALLCVLEARDHNRHCERP